MNNTATNLISGSANITQRSALCAARGSETPLILQPRVDGSIPGGVGAGGVFKTILADPPWQQELVGKFARRQNRRAEIPYPTMTVAQICALPIGGLAAPGAHLWLWTTNSFLEAGFEVMRAWGFRYLAPVTWVKPSGCGAWFVHRTQTLLFGYRKPLVMRERYKPTVFDSSIPREHSAKPEESYRLIETVSESPRIEIFARPWTPLLHKRDGWSQWGNEVACDVVLSVVEGVVGLETSHRQRKSPNEKLCDGAPEASK